MKNSSDKTPEEFEVCVKLLDRLSQQALSCVDISPKSTHKPDDALSKEGEQQSLTYFRLISSSLPPQPIYLTPCIRALPYQRPIEDTHVEERLRHERAHEVAVDASWVHSYSSRPQLPHNSPTNETFIPCSSDTDLSQFPRLLVTECAQDKLSHVNDVQGGPSGIKSCPVVTVSRSGSNDRTRKRTRKRRFPPRVRPKPRFFKPMKEWGGKSVGYAMGWRGSWPTERPEDDSYARDQMRKGITLENL